MTDLLNEKLLAELGGERFIRKTVNSLYEKIFSDETLTPFFVGVDRMGQSNKMQRFLRSLFIDNKSSDSPISLRQAHIRLVKLGLDDTHFDRVKTYLREAIEEQSVESEYVQAFMEVVESTREKILNK